MGLKEYERKRRFDETPEPRPRSRARTSLSRALRFVVQKHSASHLHYDFRLEWDGVLLSWAVPKGPSNDPQDKRLAVAVEDHPLEYARFEGVIPPDEYGGGTVMVWDEGTYVPESPNVGAMRDAGEIKIELSGKKLQGRWVLVRTHGRDNRNWLLIRRGSGDVQDLLAQAPRSVISKRTMAEIALEEGGDVETAARTDPRDTQPFRSQPHRRSRAPSRIRGKS